MMSEIGIVGGGLTGVMMAVTLSHCSESVTLLTREPPQSNPNHDDNRTTTIHAAGKTMLEVLGVWSQLPKAPIAVTRIMVAEGPSKTGQMARRQQEFGLSWQDADNPMAYVVDNSALLAALCRILTRRQVKVIHPATVIGFELVAGKAHLNCADINLPNFDLVVACDCRRIRLVEANSLQ